MSWLEPCRKYLKAASQANLLAESRDLEAQKIFIKKIGSNFQIKNRHLAFSLQEPWALFSNFSFDSHGLPHSMGGKNFGGQNHNREHLNAPSGQYDKWSGWWALTRTWFMDNWDKCPEFIPDIE